MRFCSKCGKEIMDEAVICVHCGCAVNGGVEQKTQPQTINQVVQNNESNGLAIGAIICAFLIPILGIILGIVGVCKYQTPQYKSQSITAIILSIIFMICSFAVLSAIETLLYY